MKIGPIFYFCECLAEEYTRQLNDTFKLYVQGVFDFKNIHAWCLSKTYYFMPNKLRTDQSEIQSL